MPKPEEITRIECEVIGGTPKAVQIKTDAGIWWVPRSCLWDEEDVPDRGHTEIAIMSWFIEREEIH